MRELRKKLIEEITDVLMHYNDVLICYGISADELKQAYTAKFEKNMTRWESPHERLPDKYRTQNFFRNYA